MLRGVGYPLAINLRQSSGGTLLSFVLLTENSGQTKVDIDATGMPVGYYDLYIESFDTLDSNEPTLKTDWIIIEVTNYIRDEALETTVTITQGDTLTIEVPHCYSEITITPILAINLKQPVDSTYLSYISF